MWLSGWTTCMPFKSPRGFTDSKQACTPSPPLGSGQVPLFENGSRPRSLELRSRLSVKTEAQVGRVDVERPNGSPDSSQESSPLWFSLSSPEPLGIDAFIHPWPDMRLYKIPPVKLIPAVLVRVRETGVRLLLVAPFWSSQTWLSELIPLLYRPSWEIPIR